jgi:exosortase
MPEPAGPEAWQRAMTAQRVGQQRPAPTTDDAPVRSFAVGDRLWRMALAAAAAVTYAPTAGWLAGFWLHDHFYSQGFLVAAVCAWLGFQQWGAVRAAPFQPSRWGIPLVAVGLLVEMAGVATDVMTLSALSLFPVVAGIVLACRGREALRALAFPLLYFLFAVPLLSTSSDATGRVITPMMEFASRATAAITTLLGLHPDRSGVIIRFPTYTMQVAVPCSGMASLVALMALGALLGWLAGARPARILLLVAAAIPIAIASNVARLTLTALIGVNCGARLADGFLHEVSGVFTFLLGAAMLALIPRGPGAQTTADHGRTTNDDRQATNGEPLIRRGRVGPGFQCAVLMALFVPAAGWGLVVGRVPPAGPLPPAALLVVPAPPPGWQLIEDRPLADDPRAPGRSASYRAPDGTTLMLERRVAWPDRRNVPSSYFPQECAYLAGGWDFNERGGLQRIGPRAVAGRLQARRGAERRIDLSAFSCGGEVVPTWHELKLRLLWQRIRRERGVWIMAHVVTPATGDAAREGGSLLLKALTEPTTREAEAD